MTLDQLHELKLWHQRHWREHPVEKHVWDLVLTVWVASFVGVPTALVVHAAWALAACAMLFFLPEGYVTMRRLLAAAGVLRCDWIVALGL